MLVEHFRKYYVAQTPIQLVRPTEQVVQRAEKHALLSTELVVHVLVPLGAVEQDVVAADDEVETLLELVGVSQRETRDPVLQQPGVEVENVKLNSGSLSKIYFHRKL